MNPFDSLHPQPAPDRRAQLDADLEGLETKVREGFLLQRAEFTVRAALPELMADLLRIEAQLAGVAFEVASDYADLLSPVLALRSALSRRMAGEISRPNSIPHSPGAGRKQEWAKRMCLRRCRLWLTTHGFSASGGRLGHLPRFARAVWFCATGERTEANAWRALRDTLTRESKDHLMDPNLIN